MSPGVIEKQMRAVSIGTAMVICLTVGAVALKIIQLLLFFDGGSGHLVGLLPRYCIDAALAVLLLLLIFFAVRMSAAAMRAGDFSILPKPVNGILMLFSGICFGGQAAMEMLAGFLTVAGDIDWVAAAATVLGFLSALSMTAAGIFVLSGHRRPPMLFFAIPAAWCGVEMIGLLMAYPNVLSMQSDVSRTLEAGLALLFTVDLAEQFTAEGAPDTVPRFLLRLAGPGLILAFSLPYAAGWLLGIHDSVSRMPHLAFVGLAAYGVANFYQILMGLDKKYSVLRRFSGRADGPEELDGDRPSVGI